VSEYVGEFQEHYWIPVSALVWLPSKRSVAAGASWVRCDIGFPREWADVIGEIDENWEQTVRTFSAKDAVIRRTAAVEARLARARQLARVRRTSVGRPSTPPHQSSASTPQVKGAPTSRHCVIGHARPLTRSTPAYDPAATGSRAKCGLRTERPGRDFRDFRPCMMLGRLGRYLLLGPGLRSVEQTAP
jgi:hypothetical protein